MASVLLFSCESPIIVVIADVDSEMETGNAGNKEQEESSRKVWEEKVSFSCQVSTTLSVAILLSTVVVANTNKSTKSILYKASAAAGVVGLVAGLLLWGCFLLNRNEWFANMISDRKRTKLEVAFTIIAIVSIFVAVVTLSLNIIF